VSVSLSEPHFTSFDREVVYRIVVEPPRTSSTAVTWLIPPVKTSISIEIWGYSTLKPKGNRFSPKFAFFNNASEGYEKDCFSETSSYPLRFFPTFVRARNRPTIFALASPHRMCLRLME
jgi:hypothetical protein